MSPRGSLSELIQNNFENRDFAATFALLFDVHKSFADPGFKTMQTAGVFG